MSDRIGDALRLARRTEGKPGFDLSADTPVRAGGVEGRTPNVDDIGLAAYKMTGPGGWQDMLGYMPTDSKVEAFRPSIADNLGKGHYVDAAMQAGSLVPFVGGAVKGAGRLAKMLAGRFADGGEVDDALRVAKDIHPAMRGVMDTGSLGPYPRDMIEARHPAPTEPVEHPYYGQHYNSPEVKSMGHLGVLNDARGNAMSEYSFGGDEGQFQYPSIVPGMTGKQLERLAEHAAGMRDDIAPITDEMAMNHALKRRAEGKSPFWAEHSDSWPLRADGGDVPQKSGIDHALDIAAKALRLGAQSYGIDTNKIPSARQAAEALLPADPYEGAGRMANAAAQGRYGDALAEGYGSLPQTGAIKAYHGSPHQFDRFDISKIGTGEGAQAYGHGLYFAGNEKVAKGYRDNLGYGSGDQPIDVAASLLKAVDGDQAAALAEMRRRIDSAFAHGEDYAGIQRLMEARNIINTDPKRAMGSMYEVNLDVEPHQLLDWDKPLSEQSPHVKGAIAPLVESDAADSAARYGKKKDDEIAALLRMTAGDYTNSLEGFFGGPAAASAALHKAGIPGLQYLDAGSRAAGDGSRNYVMFDSAPISILRRYAQGGDVPFFAQDRDAEISDAMRLAREHNAQPVMRAYEPSLRDKLGATLYDMTSRSPAAQRAVEGLVGSRGLGNTGASVADFVPGAGQILQAGDAYQSRDPHAMAMAVVPMPGANAANAAAARALTKQGLYSRAAEAASALPQVKGSYEQMMAMLRKAGVKPEELKWSGVDQAFAGRPNVTRDELAQHFSKSLPQIEETVLGGKNGTPKFEDYALSGGENYRELLLGLKQPEPENPYRVVPHGKGYNVEINGSRLHPDPISLDDAEESAANWFENDLANADPLYKSNHWDEPNVLAHLRMSDRTLPEGGKGLHLEELQSDWAQEGRNKGFLDESAKAAYEDHMRRLNEAAAESKRLMDLAGEKLGRKNPPYADAVRVVPELAEASSAQSDLYRSIPENPTGLPLAPYVGNTQHWTDLALKRALREAAEGGYDRMMWTPGAEQAARYDLAKQLNDVSWNESTGSLLARDKNRRSVIQEYVPREKLPDYLGKEVTDKLLANRLGETPHYNLEGEGLTVGGEGMRGYYDKIVPTQLSKLLRGIDPEARIGQTFIEHPETGEQIGLHSLDISPAMREAILRGFPAYAKGGDVHNAIRLAREVGGPAQELPPIDVPAAQKHYEPFNVLPLREDESGIHFDKEAGALGPVTRALRIARQAAPRWLGGEERFDTNNPEDFRAAMDLAGLAQTGALGGTAPEGALRAGASRTRAPKLPMDEEARMARAKELGFSGPWYHGAFRSDRLVEKDRIDPRRATSGPMPFFTDDPVIASNYAKGKADTSLAATDSGNIADYFTVAPKDIGISGRSPIPVERAWHFLSPEVKQDILAKAKRVGYENPMEAMGPLTLHPEGVEATLSPSQFDYVMKTSARGNPLSALRDMWHDSGELVGNEDQLADIYRLAGFKYPISQSAAPWTEAQGVFPAMLRMRNPLDTSQTEELLTKVIPTLQDEFRRDRTRLRDYGTDSWDKNHRFTPRDWVQQLKEDAEGGKNNSMVFTSIPDKVTDALRRMGYDSILDTGGKMGGEGHNVAIPFHPSQVRSRFATFDPEQIDSPFLGKSSGGEVNNAIEGALRIANTH